MKTTRWAIVLLLVVRARGLAEVTPSAMFGDHMVLQRDMPVSVWGTAAPGEAVAVRFAGKTESTKANEDGKWQVALPALEASSEGREMTIEGNSRVVFKDVLVGEVWVCSGQSNMQMGFMTRRGPGLHDWGGPISALTKLVPDAKTRPIRHYLVPTSVALKPQANCAGKWSPDVSGSAVAFGFSYYLNKALDVPVAVIVTCWGSSSIEGWMPLDMTAQLPHFKQMMAQFEVQHKSKVTDHINKGIHHRNVYVRKRPNILYNAMLHPVIPYACRGMVWYQGEANASRHQEYAQSLPLWVKRLRKAWGRDDFHFLVVMLPGFGRDNGRPDAKSWAWFREVQMKVLALSHAGVANTVDLGDVRNIHPLDKAPIAQRLAFLARRDVHGAKIAGQGPTYKGFRVDGNRMVIAFTCARGLKTTDGKAPTGFWLADEKRAWREATASIAGETVVLKADGTGKPVACRYAFCGKPAVNLANGDNLPAYPFRTDDWAQ